jgi:hypothetical protein
MEDGLGIGRRVQVPQNLLRSIPGEPLCNEAKEKQRALENDFKHLR